MLGEIGAALRQLEARGVRAVIRARGRARRSGRPATASTSSTAADDPLDWQDPLRRSVREIEHFPAPVIALIEGTVWGGACELAFACDLIVATPQTTFAATPAGLGVPYNQRAADLPERGRRDGDAVHRAADRGDWPMRHHQPTGRGPSGSSRSASSSRAASQPTPLSVAVGRTAAPGQCAGDRADRLRAHPVAAPATIRPGLQRACTRSASTASRISAASSPPQPVHGPYSAPDTRCRRIGIISTCHETEPRHRLSKPAFPNLQALGGVLLGIALLWVPVLALHPDAGPCSRR